MKSAATQNPTMRPTPIVVPTSPTLSHVFRASPVIPLQSGVPVPLAIPEITHSRKRIWTPRKNHRNTRRRFAGGGASALACEGRPGEGPCGGADQAGGSGGVAVGVGAGVDGSGAGGGADGSGGVGRGDGAGASAFL